MLRSAAFIAAIGGAAFRAGRVDNGQREAVLFERRQRRGNRAGVTAADRHVVDAARFGPAQQRMLRVHVDDEHALARLMGGDRQ